jgi:hypothetical protein
MTVVIDVILHQYLSLICYCIWRPRLISVKSNRTVRASRSMQVFQPVGAHRAGARGPFPSRQHQPYM